MKPEKCQGLKGRDVYLFPDLSKDGKTFEKWSSVAKKIESQMQGTKVYVSDLLEWLASEQDRQKGCDIADFLIKKDCRLFRNSSKKIKT